MAKSFPLNSMRRLGLTICGFDVGEDVYIGGDLIVVSELEKGKGKLNIGNRVAIAPRVTLVIDSDANWSNLMEDIKPVRGMIVLGDDCWIGTGVVIMPNVTIGERAIVGAGSVVTKTVPPNVVVAGVPSRIINKK